MTIKKVDGRQKRSERSRQQIIEAMIQLLHEGVCIPTAQQVADAAKISIRTVFRHFSEMDLLYQEIDQAQRPSYQRYFANQDFSGSLAERIDRAVSARINTYVETFFLEKAAHAMLWRSQVIRDLYQGNQLLLRKNLMKMLPELKSVNGDTREAVDAVASFEFFERLQMHQGLSEAACKTLMINMITGLLEASLT